MTAAPGDDPIGWLLFVITVAIPYLLGEAAKGIGEAFGRNPLMTVVGVLAALGVWKLLEFALWVIRKAWLVILLTAALGIAASVLLRL